MFYRLLKILDEKVDFLTVSARETKHEKSSKNNI